MYKNDKNPFLPPMFLKDRIAALTWDFTLVGGKKYLPPYDQDYYLDNLLFQIIKLILISDKDKPKNSRSFKLMTFPEFSN